MKRWLALGLLLGATAATARVDVIPRPTVAIEMPGTGITLQPGTPIRFARHDPGAAVVAAYFTELAWRSRRLRLASGGTAGTDRILLQRGAVAGGREAYRLDITPHRLTITAPETAGLRYGAVTAWQLMTAPSLPRLGEVTLPAVHIEDAPRYAWRGLMLDSARHFQSPEFIARMLDWMALHKLNVLQWHLTDDQGWRLQIRHYPLLTSVGGWRTERDGSRYGGFYTQAQVRTLVTYAAARGITVVPEIEMPGHALAAIRAYPTIGFAGVGPEAQGDWGVFPSIYGVDDGTFRFLETVLDEVMALFPSPVVAVGGDEAVKAQWHASAAVQAKMRELGLADETALQAYFIQRIGRYLNAHHRRLIGWDEILDGGGLPAGDAVLSWHGNGAAAVAAGHDVVLATAPTLYFDNRQSALPGEPPGRGFVVSLRNVHDYPLPTSDVHILGLQANIWTEHIATGARVEAMALPRAAALAEAAWSSTANRNWDDFEARLPAQLARYRALRLNADAVVPVPGEASRRVSQQLRLCTDKVALNLEGHATDSATAPVVLVDIKNPCWIWTAADLTGIATLAADVAALPFNYQLGEELKDIVLLPPTSPDGELLVRRDGCDGPVIATLPLAGARRDRTVTRLSGALAGQSGIHDLCFRFTARTVDPLWALDEVELLPASLP